MPKGCAAKPSRPTLVMRRCTGCTRCVNQCPIRIDVPWLNSNLRERINEFDAKESGGLLQKMAAWQLKANYLA